MTRLVRSLAVLAVLVPLSAATECEHGLCADDETSLLQVEKAVMKGTKREEAKEHGLVEADFEAEAERPKHHKKKHMVMPFQGMNGPIQLGSAGVQANVQQQMQMQQGQVPYAAPVAGYAMGMMPSPTDYHYNTMTIATQMTPGGGQDDPRRAAARAAQAEEQAERAMEDAVFKAQQEERAAMFASKRAAALRSAAERAALAENEAARAQIQAADSKENFAVRRAASSRTHARVAAYKAIVQQATAYQAAADQSFSHARAAAARSAARTAVSGLRAMEDDSRATGRYGRWAGAAARRAVARNRFAIGNAVGLDGGDGDGSNLDSAYGDGGGDGYGMDQGDGDGGDSASMYSTGDGYGDGDLQHCGGFQCRAPTQLLPDAGSLMCGIEGCSEARCCSEAAGLASAASASCKVGDVVDATYSGDGRQYRAKISAANPDQTYTVNWLDDFEGGNAVPSSQVFLNGQPCNGGM